MRSERRKLDFGSPAVAKAHLSVGKPVRTFALAYGMKKIFIPITEAEKEKAFLIWYRQYEPKQFDQQIQPFLEIALDSDKEYRQSWLRKTRVGLFLSIQGIAENLNVTRSAYMQYEEKEINGTINLATLSKVAEAMNCEVIYAIRPKSQLKFSECIWKKLLLKAENHPWLKACDPKQKSKALSAIAVKFMNDPKFKRDCSWSQRSNKL